MKRIITIDATNTVTRAILWEEDEAVATSCKEAGLSDTVRDGNNGKLKMAAKTCIEEVLRAGNTALECIDKVVACGMLTSGIGLYELPHIKAPAGVEDYAAGMKAVLMEDVCDIPIWFIPGMKNAVDEISIDTFEEMDIMRGEEIDCAAILSTLPKGKPYVVVLSEYYHTKFISVNADGKMTGCLTTITGDILSSITNHIDIGDCVGRKFLEEAEYDKEMVLRGFCAANKVGLGRIGFSTKILNIFVEKDKTKLCNFLLGAVLSNDVQCARNSKAIKVSKDMTVVVHAEKPLGTALVDVLTEDGYFSDVRLYQKTDEIPLVSKGAKYIADRKI